MNINSEMSNSLVIDMDAAGKRLRLPEPFLNATAKTAIVLMVLSAVFAAWGNIERFEDSLNWLKGHKLSNIYILLGKALFLINVAVLLWRVLLVVRYRPVEPCGDDELPICTVIIPAYNEGDMVVKTLHSVAESDYPANKLQIIAVDDGSKDDTWHWIQHAAAQLGTKIETIRLEKNCG
jgi:hyaluronan synthase